MLIYCIQVCTFLTTMIGPTDGATGCSVGLFGSICQLSCNCERSRDCNEDGSCPNNEPCKRPFFGLGCQYVDLLFTHGSTTNPTYITDQDHTTCNPDPNATSVQVTLVESIVLTWSRLYVSNSIALLYRNFTVKVDGIQAITYKYKVHETAIDVRTVVPGYSGASITTEGLVARYICTINVSGGRNVARNQRVIQSSNFSGDPLTTVRAENAIDGNNSPDYASGTCSRTEFETGTTPYWNVTLDQDYWFFRMVVYNSNVNMAWLSSIRVRAYNQDGPVGYRFTANSASPLPVYKIILRVGGPFSAMRIEADNVVMLCEVEIFAEPACQFHKYGLECQHKCQCNQTLDCSVVVGSCLYTPVYYCPPGTHGELCELPCSEHCQSHLCNARSGTCLGCMSGYLGELCDQVCELGTYGPNCSLICSENCAEPCDYISGSCACVDEFAGHLCTECSNGWFGDNCSEACPSNCLDQLCDNTTGNCLSCLEHWTGPWCEDCEQGWFGENCSLTCPRICPSNQCDNITGQCLSCVGRRTGPKCEDCPAGYYGALCDLPCSVYCRNRTCNKVDGICYRCVDGYKGEYCNLAMEDLYPSFWLLPLLVPFVVLVACCMAAGGGDTHAEED